MAAKAFAGGRNLLVLMACCVQKLIVGGGAATRPPCYYFNGRAVAHERQLINSAAMTWRPISCEHPLQTMYVQSIVTFNTVQGPDPQDAKADQW
jgi:hypothetical protein